MKTSATGKFSLSHWATMQRIARGVKVHDFHLRREAKYFLFSTKVSMVETPRPFSCGHRPPKAVQRQIYTAQVEVTVMKKTKCPQHPMVLVLPNSKAPTALSKSRCREMRTWQRTLSSLTVEATSPMLNMQIREIKFTSLWGN